MITIHLNKLEFFAHHGLHEEERVIGTVFEVSVSLQFDAREKIVSIHQTIDYTDVYEIIKKHMIQPVALLEMLAANIAESIFISDNRVRNINITINKKNPSITGFTGEVGVSYQKEFDL